MSMITRHRPAALGIAVAGCLAAAAVAVGATSASSTTTSQAAAVAQSQADSMGPHAHPAPAHPVTLAQARRVAVSTVPGTVVLAATRSAGSGTLHEVTIARADGSAVEVDVDARTGRVVHQVSDAGDQPEDRVGNHPEEDTPTPAAPQVSEDRQRQLDRLVRHSGPQFRE